MPTNNTAAPSSALLLHPPPPVQGIPHVLSFLTPRPRCSSATGGPAVHPTSVVARKFRIVGEELRDLEPVFGPAGLFSDYRPQSLLLTKTDCSFSNFIILYSAVLGHDCSMEALSDVTARTG